jgi:hypothetical protein
VRWLALVAGLALLVFAFAAAGRVTDSRQGLVAEIVTLLGGGAGFMLVIYGVAARRRAAPQGEHRSLPSGRPEPRRTRRDLLLGAAGIALGLVLLSGLALSGGPLWAGFGLALLLPMLAGSVYLCLRYLRANP